MMMMMTTTTNKYASCDDHKVQGSSQYALCSKVFENRSKHRCFSVAHLLSCVALQRQGLCDGLVLHTMRYKSCLFKNVYIYI
jgi:hypothetical protein